MNSIKKMLKLRSLHRNIKAVSPVIATIIIVAIAITMSIAVAYWMLGLGSSFTKYEKVEFTTAYVDYGKSDAANFTISMQVKNTGSAAATIDTTSILYNGKPASAYMDSNSKCTVTVYYNGAETPQITLSPGETSKLFKIELSTTNPPTTGAYWSSGMTLEIMLHTTGGKDYPKVVVLP